MNDSDLSPAEHREADLRSSISTWLTLAHDSAFPSPVSDLDLMRLRDWVDGGCVGDMPEPEGTPPTPPSLADQTRMGMQVFMETRNWNIPRLRKALVEARLRQR